MVVIAQPTMAPTGVVVSHSSMQVSGGAPMAYPQLPVAIKVLSILLDISLSDRFHYMLVIL